MAEKDTKDASKGGRRTAFAVNLYCAARATNGYGRQSEYDSSATIAFALLKK